MIIVNPKQSQILVCYYKNKKLESLICECITQCEDIKLRHSNIKWA